MSVKHTDGGGIMAKNKKKAAKKASTSLLMLLIIASAILAFVPFRVTLATGTTGVKLDVGPVGGLGGHGSQTGKIVGILKSRRVKITDLILPTANYKLASDEMQILADEGVRVHPVTCFRDCSESLFGVKEDVLIQKITDRLDSLTKGESAS
jgi:hypothetical protein